MRNYYRKRFYETKLPRKIRYIIINLARKLRYFFKIILVLGIFLYYFIARAYIPYLNYRVFYYFIEL